MSSGSGFRSGHARVPQVVIPERLFVVVVSQGAMRRMVRKDEATERYEIFTDPGRGRSSALTQPGDRGCQEFPGSARRF